jgi:hypothetical protein
MFIQTNYEVFSSLFPEPVAARSFGNTEKPRLPARFAIELIPASQCTKVNILSHIIGVRPVLTPAEHIRTNLAGCISPKVSEFLFEFACHLLYPQIMSAQD